MISVREYQVPVSRGSQDEDAPGDRPRQSGRKLDLKLVGATLILGVYSGQVIEESYQCDAYPVLLVRGNDS
jgi:hypothetical protein